MVTAVVSVIIGNGVIVALLEALDAETESPALAARVLKLETRATRPLAECK